MFTTDEIKVLVVFIDTGIKNLGIGLYNDNTALKVQSILVKLAEMNVELQKPKEEVVEEIVEVEEPATDG